MNAAQQKAAQKAEAARAKKEQQAIKKADQGKGKDKDKDKPKENPPAKKEESAADLKKRVEELEKENQSLKATNAKHAERNKKNREAILATNEFRAEEVGSDLTPCIQRLAAMKTGGESAPRDDSTLPKPAHGSSANKRADGPHAEGGYEDPRDLPPDGTTAANPDGDSEDDE